MVTSGYLTSLHDSFTPILNGNLTRRTDSISELQFDNTSLQLAHFDKLALAPFTPPRPVL